MCNCNFTNHQAYLTLRPSSGHFCLFQVNFLSHFGISYAEMMIFDKDVQVFGVAALTLC